MRDLLLTTKPLQKLIITQGPSRSKHHPIPPKNISIKDGCAGYIRQIGENCKL